MSYSWPSPSLIELPSTTRTHDTPKQAWFIRPFLSSDAVELSPESLEYQGSLARLNSFLVFGVRYKDCGVFGTTFIESSYDSSSLPSAYCRNKRNKTKRNFIWAFYLVPKHWRPGRVLSTLLKTDTTCVTSTKCPSREKSSKVSKERQGQNSGCQLTLVKMMALNQNQIWHT